MALIYCDTHKKNIFSQIMSLVSRYDFLKCVDRYKGDRHSKHLLV